MSFIIGFIIGVVTGAIGLFLVLATLAAFVRGREDD